MLYFLENEWQGVRVTASLQGPLQTNYDVPNKMNAILNRFTTRF